MTGFGGYDDSERGVAAQMAQMRSPADNTQQQGFDQVRQAAYTPEALDRQAGRTTNQTYDNVPVNTRVADRYEAKYPVVGRDGQTESQKPVLDTVNYNAKGQALGSTHYLYSDDAQTGVKLNGFIDRDLHGNITELVVRKPNTVDGQPDEFFEFRAPPGHPFDKNDPRIFGGTDAQGLQYPGILNLLNPEVSAQQSRQNQAILNQERPMAEYLQNNKGQEIIAMRVDSHTGQRFAIRDMRYDSNTQKPFIDPETRRPIERQNPVLCWLNKDGTTNRFEISNMTPSDQDDLAVARGHGNFRTPLQLFSGYWRGRPVDTQPVQPVAPQGNGQDYPGASGAPGSRR